MQTVQQAMQALTTALVAAEMQAAQDMQRDEGFPVNAARVHASLQDTMHDDILPAIYAEAAKQLRELFACNPPL